MSLFDSILLSQDSSFHIALFPSARFIFKFILSDSLAFTIYCWSHFRHYSLPVINNLAGTLEKLIYDAFIVGWMPSLAGAFVASGTLLKDLTLSKVQFSALTHAS